MSYKFSGDAYEYGRENYNGCNEQRDYGKHRCGDDCDEYLVLAIASVPMQNWRLTYSPEKALHAGTMFSELNLPFKGGRCR